ncbi:hypothetical protein CAEBREN_10721 [Caenorhabditis brenneri]|uniref:Uncharacterized protein n=1 Tax=Caenorhabditis brenneri TaxID=135651 RepID=G0N677_CAEBE|nr:hypothetical protein CAEBREN_10721 [Caenorhabditis brenneri]
MNESTIANRQKRKAKRKLLRLKSSTNQERKTTPSVPKPIRKAPQIPTPEERTATETLRVLEEFHQRFPSHPKVTIEEKKEEARNIARIIERGKNKFNRKGSPVRFDFTDSDSPDYIHDEIMRTLMSTISKLEEQAKMKDEKIEMMEDALALHAHLAVENHELKLLNGKLIHENRGMEQISRSMRQMGLNIEQPVTNIQMEAADILKKIKMLKKQLEVKEIICEEMAMMEELITKTNRSYVREEAIRQIHLCQQAYAAHIHAFNYNMDVVEATGRGVRIVAMPPLFRMSKELMAEYEKESKNWTSSVKQLFPRPEAVHICPTCKNPLPGTPV